MKTTSPDHPTRRAFLKTLAVLPVVGAIRPAEARPTIQPAPLSVGLTELDGVTAIARVWDLRDVPRCRLCPEGSCCAIRVRGLAYCVIATDDPALSEMDDDDVAAYDSRHLEWADA